MTSFGFKVRCQGDVIGARRGSLRATMTVQAPSNARLMHRGVETAISCALFIEDDVKGLAKRQRRQPWQ